MKYRRFEDLPVWQAAVKLAVAVFEVTERDAFTGKGDLRNQMQRAAVSISNNIAEGFERGSTELLNFLYIARGSAGGVRSMLEIVQRLPGLSASRQRAEELAADSESISRQLRAWADSLQNSAIAGQKHLNDKSRTAYEQDRRARQFMESIRMKHPPAMNPPPDANQSNEGST